MNSGILIYGYNKSDAERLQEAINNQLNTSLFVKSANGKEDATIQTILDSSDENKYKDETTKIIMFININDKNIQKILQRFPVDVERPIFCGVTEHNISWSFTTLKNHLLQEKRYWQQHKNQSS